MQRVSVSEGELFQPLCNLTRYRNSKAIGDTMCGAAGAHHCASSGMKCGKRSSYTAMSSAENVQKTTFVSSLWALSLRKVATVLIAMSVASAIGLSSGRESDEYRVRQCV